MSTPTIHLFNLHPMTDWRVRVVVHNDPETFKQSLGKWWDNETRAIAFDFEEIKDWQGSGVLAEIHLQASDIDQELLLHEARHAVAYAMEYFRPNMISDPGAEFDADAHGGFMDQLLKTVKPSAA